MKLYPIPPRVGTLAPEHREDAVKLLKAAKPLLTSPGDLHGPHKSIFICNALYETGWKDPVFKYLEALIATRLGGQNYVGWLIDQDFYDEVVGATARTQASRLAWMDDMIEEFSS